MKDGVALLQDAYKTCTGEEKSYKKTDIFNQIIQVYLENEIYFEAERMYIEEIKARGGVNCEQMGLIVMILILIQGEAKRAEKEMYELSNMYLFFEVELTIFWPQTNAKSEINFAKHTERETLKDSKNWRQKLR